MSVSLCPNVHVHARTYMHCAAHTLRLIVLTERVATAATSAVAMEMTILTLLSVDERHDVIVVTIVAVAIELAADTGRLDRITP